MSHLPPGDPYEAASGPGGPLPDPLVTAALALLRAFYISDRYTAAMILRYWARYDQLTADQIRQVLDAYPSRGRPGDEQS